MGRELDATQSQQKSRKIENFSIPTSYPSKMTHYALVTVWSIYRHDSFIYNRVVHPLNAKIMDVEVILGPFGSVRDF